MLLLVVVLSTTFGSFGQLRSFFLPIIPVFPNGYDGIKIKHKRYCYQFRLFELFKHTYVSESIFIKVIENFCSLFFVYIIADNKFSMKSSIDHSHQWELAILYYTGYTEYLQTQHILLLIQKWPFDIYCCFVYSIIMDIFCWHYHK